MWQLYPRSLCLGCLRASVSQTAYVGHEDEGIVVATVYKPCSSIQGLILNPTFFSPTAFTVASRTSNANLHLPSTLPPYSSVRSFRAFFKN